MPLREYECKKCKHVMEKIVFFGEKEDFVCEKCGSKVEKIMSTFSFDVNGFSEANGYSRKKE